MLIFHILLACHIAGGSLALLLGTVIMFIKKGNNSHRKLGLVFFYSMLIAGLSSLGLAVMHPNYFLFMVGIFSLYLLLSGRAYLTIKSVDHVRWFNYALAGMMLAAGIGFIILGGIWLINGNGFGIVFIVFGSIGSLMSVQDMRTFRGKSAFSNFWLTTHLQRMLGSYIAAITAFLVVNNTLLPGVIAWLLPTAVVTPLIVIWTTRYGIVKKSVGDSK